MYVELDDGYAPMTTLVLSFRQVADGKTRIACYDMSAMPTPQSPTGLQTVLLPIAYADFKALHDSDPKTPPRFAVQRDLFSGDRFEHR